MNDLTPRQRQTLDRGLATLRASSRARRSRRRTFVASALASSLILTGLAVGWLRRTDAAGLPAYVEIITDDRHLAAELEMANACERVSRDEGRLLVVECTAPGTGSPERR